MRLARPFFQFPVLFDTSRLQAEVIALPAEAWVPHPDHVAGNSAVRLISPDGVETDSVHGQMLPTAWLASMPYVRQVLASFDVVWSRSRLMRLGPGASVPEHADINYHWHTRVRVHIPIFSLPEVRFHCDAQSVHMAMGEAWIFDSWRPHRVENGSNAERVHLVADTTGTAAFWALACDGAPPREQWRTMPWDPGLNPELLTECDQRPPVMPAAEVQLLVEDFRGELVLAIDTPESRLRLEQLHALLEGFVFDWRQLCARHGVGGRGRQDFERLAGAVRDAARSRAHGIVMRTNNVTAFVVLEKRVLQHLVAPSA